MPRLPRIAFANTPHHITQRGHRGNDVFFTRADRVDYLSTLVACKAELDLRLYAYCLMTNHVHFVIDPGEDPKRISQLMHRLASRHARRLNKAHGWSGSIWESRFHSSPIDTERYLLTCGRYVDLNPVRAQLVQQPEAYEWSSYRTRAGLAECSWLDSDPALEALAISQTARAAAYRELAAIPIDDDDLERIRAGSVGNRLTGDESFELEIQIREGIDLGRQRRRRQRHSK